MAYRLNSLISFKSSDGAALWIKGTALAAIPLGLGVGHPGVCPVDNSNQLFACAPNQPVRHDPHIEVGSLSTATFAPSVALVAQWSGSSSMSSTAMVPGHPFASWQEGEKKLVYLLPIRT